MEDAQVQAAWYDFLLHQSPTSIATEVATIPAASPRSSASDTSSIASDTSIGSYGPIATPADPTPTEVADPTPTDPPGLLVAPAAGSDASPQTPMEVAPAAGSDALPPYARSPRTPSELLPHEILGTEESKDTVEIRGPTEESKAAAYNYQGSGEAGIKRSGDQADPQPGIKPPRISSALQTKQERMEFISDSIDDRLNFDETGNFHYPASCNAIWCMVCPKTCKRGKRPASVVTFVDAPDAIEAIVAHAQCPSHKKKVDEMMDGMKDDPEGWTTWWDKREAAIDEWDKKYNGWGESTKNNTTNKKNKKHKEEQEGARRKAKGSASAAAASVPDKNDQQGTPSAASVPDNKTSKAPPKAPPKRHPRCRQQELCIGHPSAALIQHMVVENGEFVGKGDIYCAVCWDKIVEERPYLRAAGMPLGTIEEQLAITDEQLAFTNGQLAITNG